MVGRHFVTVSSSVITLQGITKPLYYASYDGNLEMVEVLIDRGAEINLPNEVRGHKDKELKVSEYDGLKHTTALRPSLQYSSVA